MEVVEGFDWQEICLVSNGFLCVGVGFCRNNDWDEANPSTWDSHTSTPQYQVCDHSYKCFSCF